MARNYHIQLRLAARTSARSALFASGSMSHFRAGWTNYFIASPILPGVHVGNAKRPISPCLGGNLVSDRIARGHTPFCEDGVASTPLMRVSCPEFGACGNVFPNRCG